MPATTGVQKHLITGGSDQELVVTPAVENLKDQYSFGGDTNYPNPMDPVTAGLGAGMFEGQGLPAIQSASAAQSAGLDSGAGSRGDMVNMASASDNSGGADGGPSADAYGPRFTGRS